MNRVVELFGRPTSLRDDDWGRIVAEQQCPFLGKTCYKIRKSNPQTSIGSCTVLYGELLEPIVICPTRLIDRGQIFLDSLHLLTTHEPGNELHVVSEVSVPGGSIDYFLVSVRDGKVKDFVGIELQTLDTTGTVWPERQRLLKELGVPRHDKSEKLNKLFGMNWKMTAKTILVQLHHKIKTIEHINKRLVLVTQDKLLNYMMSEFDFGHLKNPALIGDSLHLHAYKLRKRKNRSYKLMLNDRLSTDAEGSAICLGLRVEARVESDAIVQTIQAKINSSTLFQPV
ncbi:MAG: NotI family restriction endonuclease [Nitrospira sp.]|nr:NotI family restriction endonuclease [Nitrospira sp.]